MKTLVESLVAQALAALPPGTLPDDAQAAARVLPADIERTRDAKNGDFACTIALRLAKAAKKNPRQLAEALKAALPANAAVQKVEIAGPGFINFFLSAAAWQSVVGTVLAQGKDYGRSTQGAGRKTLVEFVSANPTGPLHVGHGRHAAFGATLSNLLGVAGYDVQREYYINDAGRQMEILGVSTWLRYLEQLGESFTFPSNGYRGDYLLPLATALQAKVGEGLRRPAANVFTGLPPDAPDGGDKDAYIDAVILRARELIGEDGLRMALDVALDDILGDIRQDLAEFGVTYDRWYSERSLTTHGAIDRALERLKSQGRVFEKDGALWFRATEFGDEKDRVVVRENGVKTYFASDIAYHLEKRERGFDLLLDILGADHHGYVARVRAGLEAMGEPGDSLEVRLVQFVTLFRGEEKVQMSTRSGEFITLRQLRQEVGNDACRFYYVMRSNDQHLDFDLELAKKRSNDNPVYYIQYAHARVCSVLRQLADRGLKHDPARGVASLDRLVEPQEQALATTIAKYPELIDSAAAQRAPHLLVHYLRELANDFHSYYNAHAFIVDDEALRDARLALVLATRQVLQNGLAIVGVSAPESM